jgi:putative transposase
MMCHVLKVSRSGYYVSLDRAPSARQRRTQELLGHIAQACVAGRGVYGSPRVTKELNACGIKVCENTVARLMNQRGIRAKTACRFKVMTTDSNHPHPVAANTLDRDFKADLPNQKWCVDITYIPTGEGWLYLAGVIDLCSRRIVGWSMADHLRSELCEDALSMAILQRHPCDGLLHHSDRGVQYACDAYGQLCATHGIEPSMSRVGNCYDNAVMESFWGTLKQELVYHEKYQTREQARRSIFEWIEVFYNRQRRHSAIGYLCPEAFEASLN